MHEGRTEPSDISMTGQAGHEDPAAIESALASNMPQSTVPPEEIVGTVAPTTTSTEQEDHVMNEPEGLAHAAYPPDLEIGTNSSDVGPPSPLYGTRLISCSIAATTTIPLSARLLSQYHNSFDWS
jgi:hypothetical protein